jgi:hypothetical protein
VPKWTQSEDNPDVYHVKVETEQLPEGVKPMAPLRMGQRGAMVEVDPARGSTEQALPDTGRLDGVISTEVRPVPELSEVNPFNLLQKFTFKDQEETDDFVQGDGFFIFGRAPQAEGGLLISMTQLYYGVKARGARLVLLANDILKLRPAALFFIANLGACFDEIRFVESAQQYWQGVDVLVTASERLLAARPDEKQVAFRLTEYNQQTGRQVAEKNREGAPLTQPVTYVRGIAQLLEYFPSHLTSFDEQD